jgi:anti-sigma factor RsiW
MSKYCRRSEDLSAYLDGELDEKTRLNLEMHLGDCFACKEMLQDLRCLHGYFQGLPHQEVGFDLAPVVLAELGRRVPSTSRRPRFNWWHLLPVSFTAAATVSLGVFLGTSLISRPDAELVAPTLAMFDPIPPGGICIGFAECYPKEKI